MTEGNGGAKSDFVPKLLFVFVAANGGFEPTSRSDSALIGNSCYVY
jgi:hypothetical protein